MNPRSIHFRLIVWYAGVLLVVLLGFGAFTYTTLHFFINQVLRETLMHRAQQIGELLTEKAAIKDQGYVQREIEKRYDPAANDRFVRVTHLDGSQLYLSNPPNDRSFVPVEVPVWTESTLTTASREITTAGASRLRVVMLRVPTVNGTYAVEVGGSLASSDRVLHTLLLTLLGGLPVVLAVVIAGGYVLTKRALRPVQSLMQAAREITLHNLSRRLPALESGDEIARLSEVLNQMIVRLDEAFQNTTRFTADASHELRTPLTIFRGELEVLLSRTDLTAEVRPVLEGLLDEVERLGSIVESLLALARLDSGEAQRQRTRLDLAGLVESTAEQMSLLAEDKHIEFACTAETPVEVLGDRTRLQQVVVNLLDNAVKYTPEGGKVWFGVRAENGTAIFEVSDNGPGVPALALPHLFERFFRADEVRSRTVDGAGLGLSIVQSICTAHGGSVSAENQSTGGCRFTVRLPRAQEEKPV